MDYNNLDPLYKILCLALIFLVPLGPAWGLYKIAPTDKFFAKGTFSGFRINATGSAGIYIVLFSAIYLQTTPILKQIDRTQQLTDSIAGLQKKKPWKIIYKLKLMDTDGKHEIDPVDYSKYVQLDSIICAPRSLISDGTNTFHFYVDKNIYNALDDPIPTQVELNGYGKVLLPIAKNNSKYVNSNDHTITMYDTILKVTSKPSQLRDLNLHRISALTQGSLTPPKP